MTSQEISAYLRQTPATMTVNRDLEAFDQLVVSISRPGKPVLSAMGWDLEDTFTAALDKAEDET